MGEGIRWLLFCLISDGKLGVNHLDSRLRGNVENQNLHL